MAEVEEHELCSIADELSRKELSSNSSPSNPSRQMCINYVLVVKVVLVYYQDTQDNLRTNKT